MVTYIENDRLPWKGISWVWCQGSRVDRSNAWIDDNGDLNLRMQKFDGIYKGVLFETPTPSAPFSPVYVYGESITVDTTGKVLVLPTGHPYLLPKYNEFTLTEGRALPEAGTYTFTNDFETELGILNLNKNFIVCCDPAGNEVDFYLFTYKPTQLKYTVDGSGTITQLILYPGNGLIYHGQITFFDLTRDSNSDLIPDFLDSSVLGSLSKFLQSYATVDGTPGAKQFLTAGGKEFLTADGKYLFVRA